MTTQQISTSPAGTYSFQEAALYVRATLKGNRDFPKLTTRHFHSWLRKGLVEETSGTRGHSEFVSFLELVSLRMIAMLRSHRITNEAIQTARDCLQERFGWEYPFAMQPLWLSRPEIFVELDCSPVSVSQHFQSAFNFMWTYLEPVGNELHGLTFNESNQATSWEPRSDILLSPHIQFGEPCIKGTKIPTETLWALHQGGDSTETLAYMYDIPQSKVEVAIDWEKKVAHAAKTNRFSNLPP